MMQKPNLLDYPRTPDGHLQYETDMEVWRSRQREKLKRSDEQTALEQFAPTSDPIQIPRAEYEELQHTKKLYGELLYNVASKYENETRHQTALRYIRHAEEPKDENCAASEGEKHE